MKFGGRALSRWGVRARRVPRSAAAAAKVLWSALETSTARRWRAVGVVEVVGGRDGRECLSSE